MPRALASKLANPLLDGPPLRDEPVAFVQHPFTEEEAPIVKHLGRFKGKSTTVIAKAAQLSMEKAVPALTHFATVKPAIRPETFMQQRTGSAVVFIRRPETGAALHPHARLLYLEQPPVADEALRPQPRRNPRGLNLLTTIPQRGDRPAGEPREPDAHAEEGRRVQDAATRPHPAWAEGVAPQSPSPPPSSSAISRRPPGRPR